MKKSHSSEQQIVLVLKEAGAGGYGVVDNFTRGSIAIEVDTSIAGARALLALSIALPMGAAPIGKRW